MSDEEVGQIRPWQQERGGVRHEHGSVEERPLVEAAPARNMDEHGREEDHGGVEVEHRGHAGDERQQREQEDARREGSPRQAAADRLEDPVGVDGSADQQQAGDEYEGRPCLLGRG